MKNVLSWNQMLILCILIRKDKSKKITVKKLFLDIMDVTVSLGDENMSQSGLYQILRKFEQMKYITVTQIPFGKKGIRTQDIFQITKTGQEAYHFSRNKYLAIFSIQKAESSIKK